MSCPDYSIIQFQAILLIIVVIIATTFSVFMSPTINRTIWNCIKRIWNKEFWDKQRLQDKIDSLVERVFDRILEIHCIQGERKVYKVLKYKAPHFYIGIMLYTFNCLIISAISEFWNQFLFEESNICTNDEYTCCYDANQVYPQRLDCSNSSYLKTNNVTSIICYKFAFRLGTATGSTLGLVTSCVLGLLIITRCLLKISKGTRVTIRRAALTLLVQICLLLLVVVVTLLIYYYRNTSHGGAIFYGLLGKDLMIAYVGGVLFNYIVFFPWWKFEKIQENQDYKNIQNDTNP